MKNVKEVIAKNIIDLRKVNNLTQAQLGEMINYSDKAVSKWERGESTIDVETLNLLAETFNVSIEYFFQEQGTGKDNYMTYSRNKYVILRKVGLLGLFDLALIFIAVAIFVTVNIQKMPFADDAWILYIWLLPLLSLTSLFFCRKNHYRLLFTIFGGVFLWSLLTSVYLTAVINGMNFWMLFLVGIPIQAAIILGYFLSYKTN